MTRTYKLLVSPQTAYILLVSWVTLILILGVGMAAVASADNAGDELANETVLLSNDTAPIAVGVEWSESLTDAANETADMTFYNATEYDDDPANATAVLSDSIAADVGNTTENEYNATNSALEFGEEYHVVLEGTDSEIADAWIEEGGGALFAGSGGAAAGVGILAIVGVLGMFVYMGRDS
ncbi:PGF-CTERM sorting domain-containing protein [Halosolutus gelatinilyticus]|uniref:PGF-CTERM sorting domain-containing protein n=1 Tax=Halosolutus gelatinilyticus TaxID=2931975 RepID=UPI001FF454C5|nr:PGF-CTERM sorting domain-containing protein [Halosolutus gelatinilyticus]